MPGSASRRCWGIGDDAGSVTIVAGLCPLSLSIPGSHVQHRTLGVGGIRRDIKSFAAWKAWLRGHAGAKYHDHSPVLEVSPGLGLAPSVESLELTMSLGRMNGLAQVSLYQLLPSCPC